MGRIYLGVGVLIGGIAGLIMSTHAFGGTPARLGFGTLAVVWLFTGARAYLAIRGGDVATHRRWMVRNFSLTFAAVTLRLYLPIVGCRRRTVRSGVSDHRVGCVGAEPHRRGVVVQSRAARRRKISPRRCACPRPNVA